MRECREIYTKTKTKIKTNKSYVITNIGVSLNLETNQYSKSN